MTSVSRDTPRPAEQCRRCGKLFEQGTHRPRDPGCVRPDREELWRRRPWGIPPPTVEQRLARLEDRVEELEAMAGRAGAA